MGFPGVSIPYRKVRNTVVLRGSYVFSVSIPYRKVRNTTSTGVMGDYPQFQSLIGRFVILNAPHDYYVADFITFAGITQYFMAQTRKFL